MDTWKQFLLKSLLFFFLSTSIHTQTVFVDTVLTISTPTFSRTSLTQVDYIESLLVNDKFTFPSPQDTLKINDTLALAWQQISADSNGWIRIDDTESGYIYYNYKSDVNKTILLEGYSYSMVYVNSVPRIGNVYGWTEHYDEWAPKFNFSFIPVEVKKGDNSFLFQVNYGQMKAVFHTPKASVQFNPMDLTTPDVHAGETYSKFASIAVINSTEEIQEGIKIISNSKGGSERSTILPPLAPNSIRKVKIDFEGIAPDNIDTSYIHLRMVKKAETIDTCSIPIRIVSGNKVYKDTFISSIDSSVQYYAVTPSKTGDSGQALFLSLHGAGVEALNQAKSYTNKNWGTVVAPTNRRPYGYNWEDIGRIDALEVLDIAMRKFKIDPERVYLTGHSMGGHGTWYVGANYSDRFAAIGPSAGWISLWSYRYGDSFRHLTPLQEIFNRASKQSDTYTLSRNYDVEGIYIIHGSADDNVPPTESRNMVDTLKKFHHDFVYHEEPGVGHWWDKSDDGGADCVDWPPMFDYFARHARPLNYRINHIKFITANPGVSFKKYWVEITGQNKQFDFSKIDITYDPSSRTYAGTTSNISRLSLELRDDSVNQNITVTLDDFTLNLVPRKKKIELYKAENGWTELENSNPAEKNPERYGTFNNVFSNNVILVYGTSGTEDEKSWAFTKARYDAETFWYNGNGSVDVIPDTNFDKYDYPDRNVILYGNSGTNLAWDELLSNAPVSVTRNKVTVEDRTLSGGNLSCFFVYPRKDNPRSIVGVISGTGSEGLRLCYMRPIMKPGFPFPDFVVFDTSLLTSKQKGIRAAGFFGPDWTVKNGEFLFE